ncbi:MAG TPA: VWA domain-containing protein [Pyrinomonadaceae bacterium]|jgi:Ca-activated chloride channel family protein|nr:VWA domain-containing protein [Pyrinomonadaceae bacterium]
MFIRKLVIGLILVIFSTALVAAQDDDTERVDSSIVRVNIGVVDHRGRPITSLGRSNFSVFEDGVKQDISYFSTSTAPFSVVVMLDMSGSTKSFRQNIQMSAMRFLDALAPEDRVAVVEFYSKVNLLNDFTTNRKDAFHSISVANGAGDTNLYKGLQFALQKLAKEGNRRKAIVVLTDGVDTDAQNLDRKLLAPLTDDKIPDALRPESNEMLTRILNRADALGVTIYPLALPTGDPARLADPTPRQIAMFKTARARLQLVADRTGGTMNAIRRLEDMGTLYALVAADLRTLYTIEYSPKKETRDGKWRAIKVETDDPELISRSRQGYFAR